MASGQASSSFVDNNQIFIFDHDPADSTVATDVGFKDMRDFNKVTIITFASALTGAGVTAFTILANSESDGSGTDVEIKAHAVGSAPDAVGDWLVLHASAEEIGALGDTNSEDLRFVTANLTADNAADESVVIYIFSEPRHAQKDLTADVVA